MSAPTTPAPTTSALSAPSAAEYGTDGVDAAAPTVRLRRAPRPPAGRRAPGLVLDVTRLWTGGLATAAVAALVALVGTLVVRALFAYAPVGPAAVRAFDGTGAGMLCLLAAAAALAATGVAHLLLVSTPAPLSYLGWIIGLCTAAAAVLPLLGTLPPVAAVAAAVLNLVVGLAVGSLVVDAAGAAFRPAAR